MERLTKRLPSGAANYNYSKNCYFDDGSGPDRMAQSTFRQKCVERLADYEDTRLTPELVRETAKLAIWIHENGLEKIKEWIKADKDGRLEVLPCKDWLNIVFGEQTQFWGIDKNYIENPIREISIDNAERISWYDGWETAFLKGVDENGLTWEFTPCEIGKTVFLTYNEAEAALEAMKDV